MAARLQKSAVCGVRVKFARSLSVRQPGCDFGGDWLKFRLAVLDDIPVMSEIRLAVKENVLSNPARITYEMYVDYLEKLGRGWVCELDGVVIGFSCAALEDASIWALFVRPEFEGLGAGKKLLSFATDWLFECGAKCVTLGTAANTRADRFYNSQGWERGEMKDDVEVYYRLIRSVA